MNGSQNSANTIKFVQEELINLYLKVKIRPNDVVIIFLFIVKIENLS